MNKNFKPLKIEDFKLTPEQKKTLVSGSQTFLPPADEDGEPLATEPDTQNQSHAPSKP